VRKWEEKATVETGEKRHNRRGRTRETITKEGSDLRKIKSLRTSKQELRLEKVMWGGRRRRLGDWRTRAWGH